ncbi:MAG: thermonuclease family protein [Rhizobiaceae bacterium]
MLRWSDYVLAAVIIGLSLLLAARLDRVAERSNAGAATIHDGDTLTVQGQRMRLRGIDAPEYRQNCSAGGETYPCGRQARAALAAMTAGKAVICNGWERDKYQRPLVVCSVGSPALDINGAMVRQGWAVAYGGYGSEEAEARKAKRGLWQGDFQRPRDWRIEHEHGRADEPERDLLVSLWSWLRQAIWP